MFTLFLPRKRLHNLYGLVGIQHCSCPPLVWGPLVLITDFSEDCLCVECCFDVMLFNPILDGGGGANSPPQLVV